MMNTTCIRQGCACALRTLELGHSRCTSVKVHRTWLGKLCEPTSRHFQAPWTYNHSKQYRVVPLLRAQTKDGDHLSNKSLPVIIETKGVPVYLYANKEDVEPEALQQLVKVAESALPVGYVSAMPDVHLGKGVTIGTVFASDKHVCPNAVGVDIGCGMCAVPMVDLHKDDLPLKKLKSIQRLLKQRIPTGFDQHKQPLAAARNKLIDISNEKPPSKWLAALCDEDKAAQQLGTLGGGNHFLEVVYDEGGRVWLMLHSGSRNIGNVTAQHYDAHAKQQLHKLGVSDTHGLNYLEINSEMGQAYLQDMSWCQDYAMANRQSMLSLMVDVMDEVAGAQPDMSAAINIHHNYCKCERCSYEDPSSGRVVERDLWVTRKGATSAQAGQLGIIPGSMGVGSFITRGKGNPLSWNSSSHGAGRKMSRTKATSDISQDEFEEAMRGVVCDTDPRVRDEAPQAYKDLTQVMEQQQQLVDVVHRLQPLVNVKGFGKKPKWKR